MTVRDTLRFLVLFVAGLASSPQIASGADIKFTDSEKQAILSHGPWPPPLVRDASNRFSGNPAAIMLGRALFFEKRLSGTNSISCATCHDPNIAFSDGEALGRGLARLQRNTPSIWNVRFNRWFGWSGATDTLWGASIRPILAASEMRGTKEHVHKLIAQDPALTAAFEEAFGVRPDELSPDLLLVATGKALAAYQETLITPRTLFDEFRDAMEAGDRQLLNQYPLSAKRGLKIFVGKGNCSLCHFGPNFTNGEFDDVAVPFFVAPGIVDPGRHGGIAEFRVSPYNRSGKFSDTRNNPTLTQRVAVQHRNWGAFKVPPLRNIARTAPYMHNGSLATLRDVVQHYSKIDEERLHSGGNPILKPLNLTPEEAEDLARFLETLTSPD